MSYGRAGLRITPTVRLLRKLGSGGMGSVWVASHDRLGAEVAVKLMMPELARDPPFVQRFAREAAAAARVRSPHVVQVFDHGISEHGLPYIVMELLEGYDLSRHLSEVGRMSPEDVVTLVGQLARALSRAHELEIVHRDIKPENIFLCDVTDGSIFAKLLDFGIAKSPLSGAGVNTTAGRILGSPYYMSPEQLLGLPVIDQRADIWSIGAVVFEALTGQRPFDARNLPALAIKIHSQPPPVPSQLARELPPAFDAWFARACARNVEERFESVRQLADALPPALGLPHLRRSDAPPRSALSSQPDKPLTVARPEDEDRTLEDLYAIEPTTTIIERRHELRRVSCIPASVEGSGFSKLSLIRNISRAGALLYTRLECCPGDRLDLVLHLEEGDAGTRVAAEVLRAVPTEPNSGLWRAEVAVRFLESIDEIADRLEQVIDRQSRAGVIRED